MENIHQIWGGRGEGGGKGEGEGEEGRERLNRKRELFEKRLRFLRTLLLCWGGVREGRKRGGEGEERKGNERRERKEEKK